jgi:hypothetical protein
VFYSDAAIFAQSGRMGAGFILGDSLVSLLAPAGLIMLMNRN